MYDSIRIKKRIIHNTILHLWYSSWISRSYSVFQSISPIPSHPILHWSPVVSHPIPSHPPSIRSPVVSGGRTCGRWSAASSGASRTSPTPTSPTSPPRRRRCWWSRRTCEAPRPFRPVGARRDDGEKPREKPWKANWKLGDESWECTFFFGLIRFWWVFRIILGERGFFLMKIWWRF